MFAWLSLLFGRLFLFLFGFSIWYKTLALALMLVALPAAINHILHSIMSNYISIIQENSGGISSVGLVFADCAGYLATKLRVPEAFALLTSFLTIKLSLKLIPFLRF